MNISDSRFNISISTDRHLPIAPNEMNMLIQLIKKIGMSYSTTNNTLTLSCGLFRTAYASLRSISSNSLKEKFVEIFFTGGPPVIYEEE